MPPAVALTRTPPPALDFSRPGTPAATNFGDIYFSTDGGLEETRTVFLAGCGLPQGWKDRDIYTIAELGFGSGLNFLATWQAWLGSGARGRLHFISVEGFPFDRVALQRALEAFPELSALSTALIKAWPGPVRGLHRLHFDHVTLTLIHDVIEPALRGQDFRADAWFLDGFTPAKNPDMWSPPVISEVARLSAPDARLATFTVAGAVRRALTEVGFSVEKKEGFGRKRHRLEARRTGRHTRRDRPVLPTIIGNGIAGASIAKGFLRRGLTPKIQFDPDHIAASGNGAALIKPRLDLQDKAESRFFLSSYLYALQAYAASTRHRGVTHLARSDKEVERLKNIVAQEPLGPDHLRWADGRLHIDSALVIDTEAARQASLDGAHLIPKAVSTLSDIDGPIILAAGYGIRRLLPDSGFRYARGQLSWTDGSVSTPVTYGGYAIPIRDRILLGATHDRIDDHATAFDLRADDDQHNLEQARAQGLSVALSAQSYRASVRVNSPDTLPKLVKLEMKETGQEIWILSGLGSRGFVFAPLLGEALVSAYLGEPNPLSIKFRETISRLPA